MRVFSLLLASLSSLSFLFFFSLVISGEAKNNVMPWMGLERTGEDITADLKQIGEHKDLINKVAFECYNLGPDADLVLNNLTQVNNVLRTWGLKTYPMISTYSDTPPHRPPDVIEHVRKVCADPNAFILTAIQEGIRNGYAGFNVDFEPSGGTEEDAVNFAKFLDTFASELHKHDMELTVDAATWDPIWNFTLLAQTSVDRVLMMSTYAGSSDAFLKALAYGVEVIGPKKLGVGLETVNPNTGKPFTDDDMKLRFDAIEKNGLDEIDIWDAPVPDNWWPFLQTFVNP